MKPLSWRALTCGERRISDEVFAGALDTERVRIFALPVWPRPFAPSGGWVVWPAASAPVDFAVEPLWLRSALVHELVHVWQAQAGVNLLLAKLRAGDSDAAYAYRLDGACEFATLNIEQQAMVVQHAYIAAHGGAAPYDSEAYSRILTAWPNPGLAKPRKI